jgi:hypothetical protein
MILQGLDEIAVSYFLTTLENIVHVDRLLNGEVIISVSFPSISSGNNEGRLTDLLKFCPKTALR